MEYYEYNLKYFIQQKNTTFNSYPTAVTPFSYNITINHIEYFIASEIFIELIHGLGYLHSQRILHRDLKESNILIDEKGTNGVFCKICDFGLAANFEGSSLVDRPMGTGNYMAHEAYQVAGNMNNLSLLLWALLTTCVHLPGTQDQPRYN
ncbi:unnamed protein product [Oppiella nova]|uniref:Protein kinase domain-containing protein n=1 Tax=Oppiella nova TaxID=334625 RepID=A0A7R9QQ85_9ACAR|nr:unnamed protein product [Oppiella nova]CAG2171467.1 unnamed protein product [Oppiella nova]